MSPPGLGLPASALACETEFRPKGGGDRKYSRRDREGNSIIECLGVGG